MGGMGVGVQLLQLVQQLWLELAVLVVSSVALQVLWRWRSLEQYPGVRGLPILGHIHLLFPFDGSVGKDPILFDWWVEVMERTGGYFLFRLPFPEWMAGSNVLITTDPRDAEHILKTKFDNYIKGQDMTDILDDLLGVRIPFDAYPSHLVAPLPPSPLHASSLIWHQTTPSAQCTPNIRHCVNYEYDAVTSNEFLPIDRVVLGVHRTASSIPTARCGVSSAKRPVVRRTSRS